MTRNIYILGGTWVTPPPRFPQPPVVAFAVPTNSFTKICDDQNWVQTKEAPITPMKNLMMATSSAVFTNPPKNVGMQPMTSSVLEMMRAPKVSHRGPTTNRESTVEDTEAMFALYTSFWVISRSSLISFIRGAKANQDTKAIKKPNHAKWKDRMWGRLKLVSLKVVALSCCFGSTGTS